MAFQQNQQNLLAAVSGTIPNTFTRAELVDGFNYSWMNVKYVTIHIIKNISILAFNYSETPIYSILLTFMLLANFIFINYPLFNRIRPYFSSCFPPTSIITSCQHDLESGCTCDLNGGREKVTLEEAMEEGRLMEEKYEEMLGGGPPLEDLMEDVMEEKRRVLVKGEEEEELIVLGGEEEKGTWEHREYRDSFDLFQEISLK